MAFEVINSAEIEVGDPIKAELFSKIKNSLDDHETRINSQETSANRVIIFDALLLNAVSANSFTGIMGGNAPQQITLTECYVQIYEKGSLTGAIEIDIKRNTTPNDTGMTSVFTTKPKITYSGASDYDKSTNQVFNGAQATITSGDHLRLDITELPGGGTIGKFYVYLAGEVS